MKCCSSQFSRVFFLLALLFASVESAHAADPIKINGPLVAGGSVGSSGLQFSPDGSRVLYRADQDTENVLELYSVSSTSGTPVKLNGALVTGGDVSFSGMQFSADSSKVLYLADQDTDQTFEAYSVPSAGGTPVKLNGTLVTGGDVTFDGLQFSPDSSKVLYRADQDTDQTFEIYSVPSGGGTPIKLNHLLGPGGSVSGIFSHLIGDSPQFSPDSSRVLYRSKQVASLPDRQVYTVPSGGGAPVLIGDVLVDHSLTFQQFSPDSSRVLIKITPTIGQANETLFSIPSTGGTPAFLNSQPNTINFQQFSPDSSRVLYNLNDQSNFLIPSLFSVPSNGGTPVLLNAPLVLGRAVTSQQFSPDSSRVVYIADQDSDEIFELYSVPSDGGTPVKLNGPLPVGGDVVSAGLQFSPDSSKVLFWGDLDTAEVGSIHIVPVDGGTPVMLNGPLVPGGSVSASGLQFNSDGSRVLYLADQETDNVDEIFIVPDKGGTPVKLNGPLVAGGFVNDKALKFSPDGSKVLYHAIQDTPGVFEAYVRIVRDRAKPGMTGDWDSAGTWDQNVVPDEVMQVFIDGFSTITTSGNAVTRNVNELAVGGSGGTGVLLLASGAQIDAVNGITVGSSGLISGDGRLDGDVSLQGNGTLTTGVSQQLRIVGHDLTIASGTAVTDTGDGIVVEGGAVSIVDGQFLNAGVLRVESGTFSTAISVDLGGASSINPATLEFTDGTDATTPFFWRIGNDAGSFGATTVSGVNGGVRSQLRGTGGGEGADLIVGRDGTGTLTVSDGGLADLRDDFILGNGSTGDGTAIVTGVNGAFRSTVEANKRGASSAVQIGLSGSGDLMIADGGLVTTSGDATVGHLAGSTGTLTIGGSSGGFDATLDVADDMGIGGSTSAAGGTGGVTINDGGLLDVADNLTIWASGTLTLNGGAVDAATVVIAGGRLEGTGALDVPGGTVSNSGVVAPGILTGELTISNGDYTQTAAGSLEIQISTQSVFDTLDVSGTADLGGVLDVSFINGIAPTAGDMFEILTAGLIDGEFDVENLPDVGGLLWNVNYGTTSVVLELSSSFSADFDGDGDVDGNDLTDPADGWEARFGTDLDGGNFLDWQRQLGSGTPLASSQAVPEPTSLVLSLVAGALLMRRSVSNK